MKLSLRRLAIVCSAPLWAFGCKDKDHAIPKLDSYTAATIDNQTQQEKYAYAEKHLTTIASGIAAIEDNPVFRELLYEEAAKETWGESSALFSTLVIRAKSKKVNLFALMAPAVDVATLEKSVFAFVGINNEVYYPQILIPNFQKKESTSARIGSKSPVYVIFNGKSSPDSRYPAYGKDAKGNFVKLGFMVDEAYSLKNEVWVVSLNEKAIGVGGAGTNKICEEGQTSGCVPEVPEPPVDPWTPPSDLPPTPGPARTCTIDGNPGMPHSKTDKQGISVFLDRLAIGCYKEDWISGASEIYFRVSSIWNTGYDPAGKQDLSSFWEVYAFKDASISKDYYLQGIDKYHEYQLGDWSRNSVKGFDIITISVNVAHKWGGWYTTPYDKLLLKAQWDNRRDEIVYMLYEFDGWPQGEVLATLKTQGGYVAGKYIRNSMQMSYRSEQDPYASGSFNYFQGSDNYACGERHIDDCSKFELITRNPTF